MRSLEAIAATLQRAQRSFREYPDRDQIVMKDAPALLARVIELESGQMTFGGES